MSIPYVNPLDGQSAHSKAVGDESNANRIARSSDYSVIKTRYGTTITQKPSAKVNDIGLLPVTWSRTAHFGQGDVAILISGSTDMPTGSYSSSGFPTLWVCEANVPDKVYSDYIVANPSLFPITEAYVRIDGVNYEPQYPEPSTLATIDSPNGRYWRALATSGTSPNKISMSICVNGVDTNYWIYSDGPVTGSS